MTEYAVRDMGSTKGLYGNGSTSSYVVLVMLINFCVILGLLSCTSIPALTLAHKFQTMPQREILIETQKFTYDIADFVADFGGFLGLLLGINCINIYNFLTAFILKQTSLDNSCV